MVPQAPMPVYQSFQAPHMPIPPVSYSVRPKRVSRRRIEVDDGVQSEDAELDAKMRVSQRDAKRSKADAYRIASQFRQLKQKISTE
jgi:hypothetical protein